MFAKNLTVLLFLCAAILIFAPVSAWAQNSVAAANSEITAAAMPSGAERLLPESVPAEFNRAFDNLITQGNGKIAGGDREVLAWLGNYKNASKSTSLVGQIQRNFRAAGWQFESQGRSGGMEIFTLYKEGAARRVVLGYFVPTEEVLVCALMEVMLPGSPAPQKTTAQSANDQQTTNSASPVKIVTAEKNALWVNLMGSEMPPMPNFTPLAPKPNKVRGYIKDWTGKPLGGATIGIRASYFAGQYSGAQGTTDANGYYEFVVPKGSAHFYNAGYQIEWGDGVAALGLHPADGKLDSFTTVDGAVENFVLLPYGVTSRENLQENPRLPATYYGGSIYIHYYAAAADDNRPMAGSVIENTMLEITLTPEGKLLDGSAGKTYVVRQPVGFAGNVTINNIPLGRYKISAKCGGKTLKLKDNRKFNPSFGLMPEETVGAASVLFLPGSAKASMVTPQAGAWNSVEITLTTP